MTVTVTHMWMIVFFVTIDDVPANIPKSSRLTKLYFFEDNAAVIRIIRTGRSPNWRHVTRTHTGDLDWLCERINLEERCSKYVVQWDDFTIILGMCAGYGVRWTAKGNLDTDASVSCLVIHISTLVFLSQSITFQQLFPSLLDQHNCTRLRIWRR